MSSKPIQFNCIYIHIISTISSSAFSKTLVSGGPMPRLICCGFAHLCPGSRTLQSSPPPAWIRISSFSHLRPHLLLLPLLLQRVCGLVTAPERRVWPFRSRIGRLGLRDSKLCSAVTHKNMVEMKPPGGPIFRIPVMRRRIVVRIETSSLNGTHKREVEQNNTLARMMSRSSDPSLESSWLVFGKQEKLKLINPITKRVFSPEKTKNFSAKEKKRKTYCMCHLRGGMWSLLKRPRRRGLGQTTETEPIIMIISSQAAYVLLCSMAQPFIILHKSKIWATPPDTHRSNEGGFRSNQTNT